MFKVLVTNGKNTLLRVVFSTLFTVFELVIKHFCVSCVMYSHLILAWKVLGLFFKTFLFLEEEGGRALEPSELCQKWILCYIILRLAMELSRPGIFVSLVGQGPHPCSIYVYKMTKTVRALWLAERSVYIRVCKHGCGVKMFCFSLPNHASTNLKKFSSSKLDKFILFTHSFVGVYLRKSLQTSCVNFFFRLSWHLSYNFKLQ